MQTKGGKKLQIQDIKLLLFILINLNMFCVFGQDISGSYLKTDNSTGTVEERVLVTFNNDSTFKEVKHGHLGLKTISTGKYILKKGILTLKYEVPRIENVIIKKNSQRDKPTASSAKTTNLNVQVYDKDGDQNRNAVLLFKDKAGQLIMGQMLDKEGESPKISLFNDLISSLVVSTLGRNDVTVDLEPLLGSDATITIFLSKVTYEKHVSNTCRFRLEKKDKDLIILLPVDDKEGNWHLKKI